MNRLQKLVLGVSAATIMLAGATVSLAAEQQLPPWWQQDGCGTGVYCLWGQANGACEWGGADWVCEGMAELCNMQGAADGGCSSDTTNCPGEQEEVYCVMS